MVDEVKNKIEDVLDDNVDILKDIGEDRSEFDSSNEVEGMLKDTGATKEEAYRAADKSKVMVNTDRDLEKSQADKVLGFLDSIKPGKVVSRSKIQMIMKFVGSLKFVPAGVRAKMQTLLKRVKKYKKIEVNKAVDQYINNENQQIQEQEKILESETEVKSAEAFAEGGFGFVKYTAEEEELFDRFVSTSSTLSKIGVEKVKESFGALNKLYEQGLLSEEVAGKSENRTELLEEVGTSHYELLAINKSELGLKTLYAMKAVEVDPEFRASKDFLVKKDSVVLSVAPKDVGNSMYTPLIKVDKESAAKLASLLDVKNPKSAPNATDAVNVVKPKETGMKVN